MPLRYSLLLLALLLASGARSQDLCAVATAEHVIEIGGVRAKVFNNGALFWRGGDLGYEVPKGSGRHSQFASGLWIGGTVNDVLHFAGSDYGPYEYWPGPLAEDGLPTAESCAAYDRIWRVTVNDVAAYNATGTAAPDLAEWPYEAGAPVVDGDGNPSNYDLAAGDRPAILGQETAWWIMNDRGGAHARSMRPALGVEVRVTAFTFSEAYADDLFDTATAAAADVATFYRYEVDYRGEAPLEAARIGLFSDPDLGNGGDDYAGGDRNRTMGYVYNSNDTDSGGNGYGTSPPSLGIRALGADPDDVCVIHWIGSSVAQGNPNDGVEAYQYLGCRWRDDTPLTFGGTGYMSGAPTNTVYSGEPPAFWSEDNIDGLGTRNAGSDRRVLVSRSLGTLQPGASVTFDLVMPWAQAAQSRTQSVQLMKQASDRLAAIPFTPDTRLRTLLPSALPVAGQPTPDPAPLAMTVGPNPASGDATLRLSLAAPEAVRVRAVDVLGREVYASEHRLASGEQTVALPTSAWAPGVYVVTADASGERASLRLTVAR